MFELEPDRQDASPDYAYDTPIAPGAEEDSIDTQSAAITAPDEWEGDNDATPETTEVPDGASLSPYTVVDIGSGFWPVLIFPDAPEIARLYEAGGTYIGVDTSSRMLEEGRDNAKPYIDEHSSPDAEVDIRWEHATIEANGELPEALEPDSADCVVVSNILSQPSVADQPELCEAIAAAAMAIVRKEPAGEVVAIGTFTPYIFPAQAVRDLMTAAGLEYVGSDDIDLYMPPEDRGQAQGDSYAERFRPRPRQ